MILVYFHCSSGNRTVLKRKVIYLSFGAAPRLLQESRWWIGRSAGDSETAHLFRSGDGAGSSPHARGGTSSCASKHGAPRTLHRFWPPRTSALQRCNGHVTDGGTRCMSPRGGTRSPSPNTVHRTVAPLLGSEDVGPPTNPGSSWRDHWTRLKIPVEMFGT